MKLARVTLVCACVLIVSPWAIAPACGALADFVDPFNYATGDLETNSGGLWTDLTGGYDVVTTPTGSASGPNVVEPNRTGTWRQTGRAFGTAVNGDHYEFRLGIYSGSTAGQGNDSMQMRITNNTSAYAGGNKNIVFQLGIDDGKIFTQQGRWDASAVYAPNFYGTAAASTWYEFRALYSVIDGADTVDIDYRNLTAGGSWSDLTVFDMDQSVDNELSLSVANNFAINCRDYNVVGLAADDAAVVPEPCCLVLCLGLLGVAMMRRWRP